MPEDLKPAEHIKKVAKRLQGAKPKLALEGRDAKGLAGEESRKDNPESDQ